MASATRNSIRCVARWLSALDHNTVKNVGRCLVPDSRLPAFCKNFSGWSRIASNSVVRCGDSWLRNEMRAYSSAVGFSGDSSGGSDSTEVYGYMTAQSGINDDMLDSLIALKGFGNTEGLPPLDMILEQEDEREKKSRRRELEKQKQMELQIWGREEEGEIEIEQHLCQSEGIIRR